MAVCDNELQKAEKIEEEYGARAHNKIDNLLENEKGYRCGFNLYTEWFTCATLY